MQHEFRLAVLLAIEKTAKRVGRGCPGASAMWSGSS